MMSNPLQDRRAYQRFPVNAETKCAFASPVLEDFARVDVQNVSMDGLGLLAHECVAIDMLMAVVLRNRKLDYSLTTLVRVVHVTERADGTYLIGGKFETPLTYDQFAKFVM